VGLGRGGFGYTVGKTLGEPALCDFIWLQTCSHLMVNIVRMSLCFPDARAPEKRGPQWGRHLASRQG